MTRTNKVRLLAATALVSLAAIAVWQFAPDASQPPTLAEVISAPATTLTEDLYPAAEQAGKENAPGSPVRTFNRMDKDSGRLVASFTTNNDQTAEAVFYQDDGIGRSYLIDLYAPLPGDAGPRQKGIVLYAADGQNPNSEEWDRLNGTAERIGHSLGDGYYVVSTLFPDGQTAETEQTWAPDMFSNGHAPKLAKEQRWRSPEEGHTIAYTDVLNDDGTREQRRFDGIGHVVMQKHIPLRPPIGTTVKIFFPGSDNVRLESTTDWWTTSAKEYRLDGTLFRILTLRAASVDARYFDATGHVPLFEQTWLKRLNTVGAESDTIGSVSPQFGRVVLSTVVELNADGSSRRVTSINEKGAVTNDMWLKYTVDGVIYGRVFFWYREDGTLSKTELMNPPGPDVPMKTIEHSAAENIKVVLSQDLRVPIQVPDELPVPPDNQPTGGH